MKKILIVLGILVAIFLGFWAWKAWTASEAPRAEVQTHLPWWQTAPGQIPTPEDGWVLDPEIPNNYIPVINATELYMVIGEDGKILEYRHRYRVDTENGKVWMWETVNPDIPEDYKAVDGFDNLYCVTRNGEAPQYFLYTRNSDGSFFFTETDEFGMPLDDGIPKGDTIPENFIRQEDNIYAVYNEYGVLTGYMERFQNSEGEYNWAPYVGELPSVEIPVIVPVTPGDPNDVDTGKSNRGDSNVDNGKPNVVVSDRTSQGYSETETITSTEVETRNGQQCYVVYETTLTYVYDKTGTLISTTKDGPYEIQVIPVDNINGGIVSPSP